MKRSKAISRLAAGILLAAILSLTIGPKPAKAAGESATVSVSGGTVEKGKDITITITVSATSDMEMFQFILEFDSSKLAYLEGQCDSQVGNKISVINYSPTGKSMSYSYRFKAIEVAESGTALIISNAAVCPHDLALGESFPTSVINGSVVITPPYQASNNANLASLSIGEAKISPDFNPDVTDYTASVAGTVGKVTVSAKAADGKASVAVAGNTNLREGNNAVTVKVTAEDGVTSKVYTITVTRAKPPTPKPATPTPTPTPAVTIKTENNELALKDKPDLKWMENTEEWDSTIIEYKNIKIGALTSKSTGVTVVELSDGNLYLLDTERGSATRYFAFDSAKQNIVLQEVNDEVIIPMGYMKTTRNIDGAEVTAFATSEKSEYALVYAKDDKGFTGWFQWDLVNGTFQRFNTEDVTLNPTPTPTPSPIPTDTPIPTMTPTAEPLPTVPTETSASSDKASPLLTKVFMGTTAGMFVLALVFLILFLVWKGRYNRRFAPDEEYQDDDEDYL